ncbi:MAG TPA: glutathione S-transferase family protein [Dongiaceae bacterium]|nr:glutathione S-transferase family protein [Dongiaceae bacterium]
MSKPKIYGGAKNRGRRCLWMAAELGIDIDAVDVDLNAGQHKTPEFLKINPNGQLPALDDGGFLLFESLAINLYLAKKYGGPLAAASLKEDALITQWSFWVAKEIEDLLVTIMVNRTMLPEPERNAAAADTAERQLQKPLAVLEATLAERDYLVGNRFTVADLNVSVVMSTIVRIGLPVGRYPKVGAWLDRCLDRPAAKGFV